MTTKKDDLLGRREFLGALGAGAVAAGSLGADHVVVGTDWPIAVEQSVPERLQKAFAFCELNAAEQRMIASENLLKLMGVA